jgi:hypothetical protein
VIERHAVLMLEILRKHHSAKDRGPIRLVKMNGAIVAFIPLTRGREAIVDLCDLPAVAKHFWCYMKIGYAARRSKGKLIMMHAQIMPCEKGLERDHINGEKLDNRRSNLRIATSSQNHANVPVRSRIGYKGVSSNSGKYGAQITYKGKNHYLGFYATAREAAIAYNKAAIKFHGKFARINDIKGGE